MATVSFQIGSDMFGAPSVEMVLADGDNILSTTPATLSVAAQADSTITTKYLDAIDVFLTEIPKVQVVSATIQDCQALVSKLQAAANLVNNHINYLMSQSVPASDPVNQV